MIDILHDIAVERYERHLENGGDLLPDEFVSSIDKWDFFDDKRIHDLMDERGIESDEDYESVINNLWEKFLPVSDTHLHDVLYDFKDNQYRNRVGDDAYFGVSHLF